MTAVSCELQSGDHMLHFLEMREPQNQHFGSQPCIHVRSCHFTEEDRWPPERTSFLVGRRADSLLFEHIPNTQPERRQKHDFVGLFKMFWATKCVSMQCLFQRDTTKDHPWRVPVLWTEMKKANTRRGGTILMYQGHACESGWMPKWSLQHEFTRKRKELSNGEGSAE